MSKIRVDSAKLDMSQCNQKPGNVKYCDYCGEYLHTAANLDDWPPAPKGRYHEDCIVEMLIGGPIL